VGEVVRSAPDLQVQAPPEIVRYLVPKGSITVDGVSLTIVDVLADGFTVAVIPHTAAVTTLGLRQPGDHVNLEIDLVAKYVDRLAAAHLLDAGGRQEGS
ncbi:MAG: riboflavin synthase, partial [Aquihabitans sp.]